METFLMINTFKCNRRKPITTTIRHRPNSRIDHSEFHWILFFDILLGLKTQSYIKINLNVCFYVA